MWATLALASALLGACADEALPTAFSDYAERCIKMNQNPISPTPDDPHEGWKNVYACDVEVSDLITDVGAPNVPYPDGTVIVKESTKEEQGFVWLVALATKDGDEWRWEEFTRNFEDEALLKIPAPEAACQGCHEDAKEIDYIFTIYQAPPPE